MSTDETVSAAWHGRGDGGASLDEVRDRGSRESGDGVRENSFISDDVAANGSVDAKLGQRDVVRTVWKLGRVRGWGACGLSEQLRRWRGVKR